ncbi:sensor histidine kinase KdpD [Bacteroides sp. 224]|uniref:sensor histidine kinase n=1 Tax=Bacteroides sp. 224 TaxID=2302936 RepID=UPI0013D4C80D|nr:HAMP domain-containing sensor histidine kinase [Bacteroides sp. 224]NDV64392.1 sensor histidine kinase [Bacteroides sp. 224]
MSDNPILIISSYNPDSRNTATNISEFIEEYNKLGGTNAVQIENMNCRSFSESFLWKDRMASILDKYRGNNKPQLIILLGQEAWASYLSQEDSILVDIPVFSAMASRNAIILPDSTTSSLKKWMPESIDFISDSLTHQIEGGFVYEYNFEDNIKFIRSLYPAIENIAFISDNTYGGVSIQAYARKEMEKFPELNLILLDGRTHTIYTIVEELRKLPPNTALLLGTWRVDENDGYFMRNATYAMMEAIPTVPVFSITSIGFGYWAIGGVMPIYRNFGKDIAHQVINKLNDPHIHNQVVIIPNRLIVDSRKVEEVGIHLESLPSGTELINLDTSFYEEYKYQIWAGVTILATLTIALLVSLFFFVRTKRLKDSLEVSEAELRVAKEAAEESNRLKSAFLANMSHEIRTPLNSIVGFSNVLAMGVGTQEEQYSYSEIIQANSDLLLRLINDILDISRLETGKVTLTLEMCDVVQLSQQVLTTMEYSKKTTNKFVFESEYTTFELNTDNQRMQQVMINLLSNASKFTKNGTITLSFDVDKVNNKAVFAVTDTGCGIPPEKRDAVFERFEKLNEYVQGTGLGLSICKLITSKWGGDIWVDPDYNDGARFIFTHPLHIKTESKS